MCHWGRLLSSASHSIHSDTFSTKPFGECISHNGWVFFWKGSSTQMNPFASHELQVRLFFIALPHSHLYSDSSATMPRIILMLTDWMLLYNTDGTEHTHQCQVARHFVPCHVASKRQEGESWWLLAVVCLLPLRTEPCLASRRHLLHVAACAGHLSVNSAMFPIKGTKRHKLHYYLRNTLQHKGCVPYLLFVNYYL